MGITRSFAGWTGRIQPATRHELVVGSGFSDTPPLQNDNQVGVANRAKTVGNDDAGSPGFELRHVGLDGAFGFGVKRAGGFIENQNRRVMVKGPAMAMRCFWPPLTAKPDSPMRVS